MWWVMTKFSSILLRVISYSGSLLPRFVIFYLGIKDNLHNKIRLHNSSIKKCRNHSALSLLLLPLKIASNCSFLKGSVSLKILSFQSEISVFLMVSKWCKCSCIILFNNNNQTSNPYRNALFTHIKTVKEKENLIQWLE